ncbi:hypothetical protein FZC66_15045 [Priestia megaterium]|nr:hypothetical protein FZC66_15045 [Priestia megaterium]
MSKLILKHYILEEMQRARIEEALLKCRPELEEDLLALDDLEILDLYKKWTKELSDIEHIPF